MIYLTGNMRPTPRQKRIVRQIADDSFTQQVPADFGPVPCSSENWMPDLSSMVALRLKCVDPHVDDWVGKGGCPDKHLAAFWVIQMPGISELILQVGNAAHRMCEGSFIVFDDSVMHSVHAKQYWRGVAYQMRCA